jgi:hypothetical protein
MKCKRGLEIKVLRSACAFYIGTTDERGIPNCKLSGYFSSEENALFNLDNGIGMVFRDENKHVCPDCTGYTKETEEK